MSWSFDHRFLLFIVLPNNRAGVILISWNFSPRRAHYTSALIVPYGFFLFICLFLPLSVFLSWFSPLAFFVLSCRSGQYSFISFTCTTKTYLLPTVNIGVQDLINGYLLLDKCAVMKIKSLKGESEINNRVIFTQSNKQLTSRCISARSLKKVYFCL